MTRQVKALNVAIVGGGHGCKAIMDMIFAEQLHQLRMKLIGVASKDIKGVGYRYAEEMGIYTTNDYRDLYKLKGLNMIIELTGREEVANGISKTKPEYIRFMDHAAARVFWDVFQIQEEWIAERKRAEESLKETMTELERSNAELEQFAYVASHDLQEPVRKIQAFGDRLKVKYAKLLDERGLDYLDRMQNAARRMQTLINDLLTLSRITTKAKPFVPVNLDDVVKEVILDLELHIEKSGGDVKVYDMPTIDADPTQMRQLLQNLINNGLKFHQIDNKPVVKIHGKLMNEVCQMIVEDNGIGFDEKYLDRIFTVFQRLHGRGEYDGTGVGLAICQKIAERHGGSITAKSTPGQGAKFIVKLPVRHT